MSYGSSSDGRRGERGPTNFDSHGRAKMALVNDTEVFHHRRSRHSRTARVCALGPILPAMRQGATGDGSRPSAKDRTRLARTLSEGARLVT